MSTNFKFSSLPGNPNTNTHLWAGIKTPFRLTYKCHFRSAPCPSAAWEAPAQRGEPISRDARSSGTQTRNCRASALSRPPRNSGPLPYSS